MNNNDMEYEEREIEQPKQENNLRYSRGGDGGPSGFFSIKTNVYSKQCYSDPNNPGKMICKETKNSSGFDPYNQENNYKNVKENVYTKEYPNNHVDSYQNLNEEPSFFQKL